MSTPSPYDPRTARTWTEVDLKQIRANAETLRRRYARSSDEVIAVVKADAYGHGAVPVVQAAQLGGISHFGFATLNEGLQLRRAGVRDDLYYLAPFLPAEADAIVRADLIPMVSSGEQLDALIAASANAPLPARCFLKVDSGMGRAGAYPDAAFALWQQAQRVPTLRVVGLATHFASADEIEEDGNAATQAQVERFYNFVNTLCEQGQALCDDGRGNVGLWLTLSNSPGALRNLNREGIKGVRGHLTRAGLLLYGVEPYREADLEHIAPVLSWRARVNLVREMPASATVGYGRTHTLSRPSHIATLAVGYADGLSRRLSNVGKVLINGKRYPIVGRVSMDQCQIDVTDAPEAITVGTVATIIGTDGGECITALDLAESIDTTPHEPTTLLMPRVSRLYFR